MLWSFTAPNEAGVAFYGKSKIDADKRNIMIDARLWRGEISIFLYAWAKYIIKLEVQRPSRMSTYSLEQNECGFFSGSIYQNIFDFLVYLSHLTVRKCNELSKRSRDNTMCKQQIDSNTMCAPMFMVFCFVWFIFCIVSVRHPQFVHNIYGKRNQSTISVWAPEAPDKFRAAIDNDDDDAKDDETNVDHGAQIASPRRRPRPHTHMRVCVCVFVNSEHLLMTIRKPTSMKA